MPSADVWSRIRNARLPRILILYLAASWLVIQVAGELRDALVLPAWVSPVVILLLLIGLIIIAATAWVQGHPAAGTRARREEVPGSWEIDLGDARESVARGRVPHLTWARTLLAGVVAFTALFAVAGAVVLLRDRIPGVSASDRTMLAVLPFQNLGSAEDEYFADGITEEITARLAAIHRLGVISRTSTLQYRKTTKPIRQIGDELGVDYILEGTVRWQPAVEGRRRVRVTPQLIRVSDDSHLWADVYDQDVVEIFAIQSDIAGQVVSALDIRLADPERRSIAERPTANLEAYDWFLRGNEHFLENRTIQDIETAVRMYERAVRLDPGFALAHARLSRAHTNLYHFFVDRTEERLALAKNSVDAAFRLAPDLAEAHLALGYWYYQGRKDYERALGEFALAQRGHPSDADVLQAVGFVHRRQGRFDGALENLREAARLDPRSGFRARELAWTLLAMRRYDEAEDEIDRAVSLAPQALQSWLVKLTVLLTRGDMARASQAAREAVGRLGENQLLPYLTRPLGVRLTARLLGDGSLASIHRLRPDHFPGDTVSYLLTRADLARVEGQDELQTAHADSARAHAERKLAAEPNEAGFHVDLAEAYALLGRKEEAIREARRAAELLPLSKDAFSNAPWRLALVLGHFGEADAAVDQLESLLAVPSLVSIPLLRIWPELDPIRDHPRFRALVGEGGT